MESFKDLLNDLHVSSVLHWHSIVTVELLQALVKQEHMDRETD